MMVGRLLSFWDGNFSGAKLPGGTKCSPYLKKKLGHQFIWRFCVHPSEGPGLGAVQLTELFRRAWAEKNISKDSSDTVDGRNPAPVDMLNIPLYIYRVSHMLGGAGFCPSTVPLESSCLGTQNFSKNGWFLSVPAGQFQGLNWELNGWNLT